MFFFEVARDYACCKITAKVAIMKSGFESKSLLTKTESMQAIFNEASRMKRHERVWPKAFPLTKSNQ